MRSFFLAGLARVDSADSESFSRASRAATLVFSFSLILSTTTGLAAAKLARVSSRSSSGVISSTGAVSSVVTSFTSMEGSSVGASSTVLSVTVKFSSTSTILISSRAFSMVFSWAVLAEVLAEGFLTGVISMTFFLEEDLADGFLAFGLSASGFSEFLSGDFVAFLVDLVEFFAIRIKHPLI